MREERSMWSIPPGVAGVEIRHDRTLEPRLERDTFSGGFNFDARVRNLEALNRCRVYWCHLPVPSLTLTPTNRTKQMILAPEHMIAKLAIEADAPYTMRRLHPATVQWLRQEQSMRDAKKCDVVTMDAMRLATDQLFLRLRALTEKPVSP